jgi:hypothetical protein
MDICKFNVLVVKLMRHSLFLVIGLIICSCTFEHKSNSMDISNFIGGRSDIEYFIDSYFDKVEYDGFNNPIFPFKVNFINKEDSMKFCTMNIQQCWVQKIDTLYSFFIVIKRAADLQKNISAKYGRWNISGQVAAQGIPIGGGLAMWSKENLNITLRTYFNALQIPEYEMCDLVIIGNMKSSQLGLVSE